MKVKSEDARRGVGPCARPPGRGERLFVALIDRWYAWLSSGPAPDCDAILSAGLEHAEAAYRQRLAEALLSRGHEASAAGLVANFTRLSPDHQQRLLNDRDRVRSGITHVIRSGSSAGRYNALAAFERLLDTRLIYLLPEALRDRSADVRNTAARLLRTAARSFRERLDQAPEDRQVQSERRSFVIGLREGLRLLTIQPRVEILESCLWFAGDLGEELWQVLESGRTHCAHMLAEHLDSWDHPHLARFLLLALARPAWRARVLPMLRVWRGPQRLAALLRESDLLDEAAVRHQVSVIRNPLWFEAVPDLSVLPEPLRRRAPLWLLVAGCDDTQKLDIVSRWLASSPEPACQRGCVYVLATLSGDRAEALLRGAAPSGSPLAPLIEWILEARTAPPRQAGAPAPPGPDAVFQALCGACQRAGAELRGQLIEALRPCARALTPQLVSLFESDAARDRLLAVQVCATPLLTLVFHARLRRLLTDPTQPLRKLSRSILDAVSPNELDQQVQQALPELLARSTRRPADPPGDRTPLAESLLSDLRKLASGAGVASDTRLAATIGARLGRLYGVVCAPAPAEPSARVSTAAEVVR